MFRLLDIKKNPEGVNFSEKLDLKADLQSRNPDILDLLDVEATGQVKYDNKMYFLDYLLSYQMTLPSSRSMEPVLMTESYPVSEIFMEAADLESLAGDVEADLILVVEGDEIDLAESVADNILLSVPLKVLTPSEEADDAYPEGQDWQVLSEEEYAISQAEKKEANSPFAGLSGLFDQE
ncbi:DUF177 domain-containing protein [Streptococcus moroccensis]|uniref:DUF177 domain-containing protein n=1 Tax=Streptococcus moroccensis TaxID=1451356 RepID=A0ABT9YPL3_9STRE|nr:YceD family protein [Streptococcus moroccensis]MDQ0221556.1 uncharacterized protein [Streptococcus moroccensis]